MANMFLRTGVIATLVAGLSACVAIDVNEADIFDFDTHRAYLLVPYDALEGPNHAAFYHDVLPALSIEHPLTNAGNAEHPWYCFGFASIAEAEYARRAVAEMDGAQALAGRLLVDETCAAG